jgi:hypothetical protein
LAPKRHAETAHLGQEVIGQNLAFRSVGQTRRRALQFILAKALLSACSVADAFEPAVGHWRFNGWCFGLSMQSDQALRIRLC